MGRKNSVSHFYQNVNTEPVSGDEIVQVFLCTDTWGLGVAAFNEVDRVFKDLNSSFTVKDKAYGRVTPAKAACLIYRPSYTPLKGTYENTPRTPMVGDLVYNRKVSTAICQVLNISDDSLSCLDMTLKEVHEYPSETLAYLARLDDEKDEKDSKSKISIHLMPSLTINDVPAGSLIGVKGLKEKLVVIGKHRLLDVDIVFVTNLLGEGIRVLRPVSIRDIRSVTPFEMLSPENNIAVTAALEISDNETVFYKNTDIAIMPGDTIAASYSDSDFLFTGHRKVKFVTSRRFEVTVEEGNDLAIYPVDDIRLVLAHNRNTCDVLGRTFTKGDKVKDPVTGKIWGVEGYIDSSPDFIILSTGGKKGKKYNVVNYASVVPMGENNND